MEEKACNIISGAAGGSKDIFVCIGLQAEFNRLNHSRLIDQINPLKPIRIMSSLEQSDHSVDLNGPGSELVKGMRRPGSMNLLAYGHCETYPALHYRRTLIPIPQSNTS